MRLRDIFYMTLLSPIAIACGDANGSSENGASEAAMVADDATWAPERAGWWGAEIPDGSLRLLLVIPNPTAPAGVKGRFIVKRNAEPQLDVGDDFTSLDRFDGPSHNWGVTTNTRYFVLTAELPQEVSERRPRSAAG